MQQHRVNLALVLALLCSGLTNCVPTNDGKNDYLVAFTDTATGQCGYKNQNGDLLIPLGKYGMCFTDTFRTYAVVLKPDLGFVAIDRQENILYNVFRFDNGPDYPSEGLFRILVNDKFGFADAASGAVIIKPQFDCAYPFEAGVAKVSTNCTSQSEGEHTTWLSDQWVYIDKTGKQLENPATMEE